MAEKENESNRLFEDEKVIEIEIERLRFFKDHPFKVTDDKEMHLLKDSIKQYGVLNPLIVRPVPDTVELVKENIPEKVDEVKAAFNDFSRNCNLPFSV